MRIEEHGKLIYIFDAFYKKDFIKMLPGARWIPETKAWRVDLTDQAKQFCAKNGGFSEKNNENNKSDLTIPAKEILVNEIRKKFYLKFLYQHQKESVSFLFDKTHCADLSDPGTGKTFTQIELLASRPDTTPALIICPKSLIDNVWVPQIKRATKELFTVISLNTGNSRKTIQALQAIRKNNDGDEVVIINYDQIATVRDELKKIAWKTIILDESTRIKNITAKRTRAILGLLKPNQWRSIMTGTVAPNGLLDIFAQYRFLDIGIFGESYYRFRETYFTPGGFENHEWFAKPGAEKQIASRIAEASIQHHKRDCTDLPALTHEKVMIEMPEELQKQYNQMKDQLVLELSEIETITAAFVITKMMKLRQLSSGFVYNEGHTFPISDYKINQLIEMIQDIGQRVIVFAHFNSSKLKIAEACIANKIKATVHPNAGALSEFKKRKKGVLIANPMSAGHGLNLQYCSNIIFYEHDFALEPYLQGIQRIERIGQKNKMTVYHILTKGTIDEYLFKKLQDKKKINDALDIVKHL